MDDALAKKLKSNGISDRDITNIDRIVQDNKMTLMAAIENINKMPKPKSLEILSQHYEVKSVDLMSLNLQKSVFSLIPAKIAETYRVVPIERVGNNIIVATGNPRDLRAKDRIKFSTGYAVKFLLASESAISIILHKHYTSKVTQATQIKITQTDQTQTIIQTKHKIKTRLANYDNEVIELADKVIIKCYQRGASDIHIEPYETFVRIRIRVDGSLIEIVRAPIEIKSAIVARFKIIGGLDIAESRLPQDGHLFVSIDNNDVNFRMSTLPTIFGEKIVLRLLDSSSLMLDMLDLGFEEKELSVFRNSINRPWGLVLVTGPTGSGKTTTLYSALQERNNSTENVLTVEDPVEFNIEGINQVQTKTKIDFTFATALRTFLRQDPDVIMVGEIRDPETANVAINAALTGHMVISTLHTNNSYETISRLISMGIEPHYVVGALLCVVAQRLVRKLCNCRVVDDTGTDFLVNLGIREEFAVNAKIYKEHGCKKCDGLGFKGRIAIHEVLKMTDLLYEAITKGSNSNELKVIGLKTGMRTLRQCALLKMIQGIVSAKEVMRVTQPDDKM